MGCWAKLLVLQLCIGDLFEVSIQWLYASISGIEPPFSCLTSCFMVLFICSKFNLGFRLLYAGHWKLQEKIVCFNAHEVK